MLKPKNRGTELLPPPRIRLGSAQAAPIARSVPVALPVHYPPRRGELNLPPERPYVPAHRADGVASTLPALLSLMLHLAPLALILGVVPGAVSNGANGSNLLAARVTQAMTVELVPDWAVPSPPPTVATEVPELPTLADTEADADFPIPLVPDGAPSLSPLPITRPEAPALTAMPAPEALPDVAARLPPPPPPPATETETETEDVESVDQTSPKPEQPVAEVPDPASARKAEAKPKPAPDTPEKPSENRRAETAAGDGDGTAAGTGGTAAAATLSQSQVNDLMATWGAKIRARIERRKQYPPDADGVSGKVTLALLIGRDGRLIGADISASSGNPALDRAALRAVERAGRFPAAPKGLTAASYAFALGISFKK